MTHIVISRLHYREDSDLLKRIEIYKKETLPSLLSQTIQEFDIGVLCHPKHEQIIRDIHPKIIPFFTREYGKYKNKNGKKLYFQWLKWKDIWGIPKYDIQTYVSSDDVVSSVSLKKIEDLVRESDTSLHIHFQPILRKLNGETKRMRIGYNKNFNSGFYSLYQPDKKNYIYIGQDSHTIMSRHAEKSILVPKGYYWINIHDDNDSSDWNL
jgi:hypothetical protein